MLDLTRLSSEPFCRQFWKAGNYNDDIDSSSKAKSQKWQNHLKIHPMFLHSNATSHKWVFGAIAELLDNAVDEIRNGATFACVDIITNPRDGSSALSFQDNGGGMNPEAIRHCMSFGFTSKNRSSDIGKYGNGFKTSTMRLGADVIVFSRNTHDGILTQNIGLLSYSFLKKASYDRIVVPMVHYKFNTSTEKLEFLCSKEQFMSNLSMLLQWSPYSTEAELLQQFDDIGEHGTKVIIYNLWHNDDGIEELDFNTDPKDIRVSGETKQVEAMWKKLYEQQIGNRYASSLRVYLSILYLRLPESFKIFLRGEEVKRHNLADDLRYLEYILYKPHGPEEAEVIVTIGFLKDAPLVNIHGFNIYNKNRLILPFWQVVASSKGKGRGIVGVLEANFVQPTHNKQDFEKTSLFQKLEIRLRDMTNEYWDIHCGLLEYQTRKTPQAQKVRSVSNSPVTITLEKSPSPTLITNLPPTRLEGQLSNSPIRDQQGSLQRKKHRELGSVKNGRLIVNLADELEQTLKKQKNDQKETLRLSNQTLRAKCLEFQKEEENHNLKIEQLKTELKDIEDDYNRLLGELNAMETIRPENENGVQSKFYTSLRPILPSSFIGF